MDLIQHRYARWLGGTTRITVAILVATYAAYVFGLIPAHVPIAQLPELWKLPASEYLLRTGLKPGWSWATFIANGDMLVLAAIALLISSSILCLAAVIPAFRKRGENLFVAMCVMQIAVLALAASGILSR